MHKGVGGGGACVAGERRDGHCSGPYALRILLECIPVLLSEVLMIRLQCLMAFKFYFPNYFREKLQRNACILIES